MREQDLGLVLSAFLDATSCAAAVWVQPDASRALVRVASAPQDVAPPPSGSLPLGPDSVLLDGRIAVRVHSVKRAWLVVGPCGVGDLPVEKLLRFLVPVIGQYL
jgi:hypothetical protein